MTSRYNDFLKLGTPAQTGATGTDRCGNTGNNRLFMESGRTCFGLDDTMNSSKAASNGVYVEGAVRLCLRSDITRFCSFRRYIRYAVRATRSGLLIWRFLASFRARSGRIGLTDERGGSRYDPGTMVTPCAGMPARRDVTRAEPGYRDAPLIGERHPRGSRLCTFTRRRHFFVGGADDEWVGRRLTGSAKLV